MIIAFTGKLGSGKDTAGERMVNMVDLPGRRVSFAAPLKESAAALFDIPVEDWEVYKNDPDAKVFLAVGYTDPLLVVYEDGEAYDVSAPNVIREFTAREVLQRYGTESHREIFGDNFWAEQAEKKLVSYEQEFIYITDARFENEALTIKRNGGLIVRVIGANDETGAHASEAGLPDEYITFEIDNTVRDDSFLNLDTQLAHIAQAVGLPLKASAFA